MNKPIISMVSLLMTLTGNTLAIVQVQENKTLISKKELYELVRANRSRMEDLTVSFTFNIINYRVDTMGDIISKVETDLVLKGEKIFWRHIWSYTDYDGKVKSHHKESAFNGKRSARHMVTNGDMTVESGKHKDIDIKDCGFMSVGLLNNPEPRGKGINDLSLVSLLKYEGAKLKDNTEEVNGHSCYVLDVSTPQRAWATIWIDCARGHLPLKQQWYGKDINDIAVEYLIDEVMEVEDSIWLPVLGRKIIYPDGSVLKEKAVFLMKVKGLDKGNCELKINTGVEDEIFNIWEKVPPGTNVWDKDADRKYAYIIFIMALFVSFVLVFILTQTDRFIRKRQQRL